MVLPCALLASCCSFKVSELARRILLVDELPHAVSSSENIFTYPWHIETKYYTADVSLCTVESRTITDQTFADAVEAFIVVFDSKQLSSFEQVALWLPYLKELQPAVQLLVCDHCADDDAVSRNTALHWCLDNSFELVELESVPEDLDDSDEDDFKETVGVQRIIEALSCHSWPNLIMKENPTFHSAYFQQIMKDARNVHNSDNQSVEPSHISETHRSNDDVSDKKIEGENCNGESVVVGSECVAADAQVPPVNTHPVANATNHDSPHHPACNTDTGSDNISALAENCAEESFEQLFERLRLMKDAAAGMTAEQRKKYAEEVTMQFWQAVGGNMDEFEGLSSDSD